MTSLDSSWHHADGTKIVQICAKRPRIATMWASSVNVLPFLFRRGPCFKTGHMFVVIPSIPLKFTGVGLNSVCINPDVVAPRHIFPNRPRSGRHRVY